MRPASGHGLVAARSAPPRRVGVGRWPRALALALVLSLVAAASAAAHPVVRATTPTAGARLARAPAQVLIQFSEPVQPVPGSIAVVGPDGRVVARDLTLVDPETIAVRLTDDAPGTYRVRWRIVAEDAHPARGSFSFVVGPDDEPPAAVERELGDVAPLGLALRTLGHWLHFVGLALGVGTLAVRYWGARSIALPAAARGRLDRLIDLGVALLLVAELVDFLGQAASFDPAAMLDPVTVSALLDASAGRVLGPRLGAALVLWLLLGITRDAGADAGSGAGGTTRDAGAGAGGTTRDARAGREEATGESRPGTVAIALGLGWLLGFLDGTVAHAGSARPAWLGLMLNALHVLAMALWLGGLVGLIVLWAAVAPTERRRVAAEVGRAAAAALAVLVATGVAMAGLQLRGWTDLIESAYGVTLSLKVGTVGLVALAAAAARRRPGRALATWRVELAGVLVVVALAGLLIALPPPD